ncbi:MAG: transporter substrate-binding domain-containing protein, partial [Alphaproteobacteria bacterium]|nr:transporter substrate-binding domain-containing protein [Alphaproteobacteria bacterium]
MKTSQALFVIALSGMVAFFTAKFGSTKQGGVTIQETAYERVMRTGVLRCGYYVFSPITIRDPNTGKLSGLGVDIIESIAKSASLKVEWTEEVDFGNWVPGIKVGRFDALCTATWPEASLAREVSFTRPTFYAGINVYARGDDHRFDNNLDAINDPKITIAVIEGTAQTDLAATYFPKAKLLRLPQNSPGGAQAENVATKKADVIFWDENGVLEYLKNNPNGLRNVAPNRPVKVQPFELAVNQGEYKL